MAEKPADGAQAHPESAASKETPAAGAAQPAAGDAAAQAAAAAAATSATEKAAVDKAAADKAAAEAAAKGTKQEPAGKAGEPGAQPKAPEKYELKVPEGGETYLAPDDLAYVEEVARANGWTNEEAQAEIDAAVTRSKAREQLQGDKLLEALKADTEYGGEHLEKTQRLAKAAIDRIFPAGHRLREAFLTTFNRGIVGNNLVYVAFLAEIGKLMGEDSPSASRAAGGPAGDAANKLYDHPTSRALDKA